MGELNGFDEFWLAYPRRVGKLAAKRMYARALKLTAAAELLRGATLYRLEQAGKDAAFTKHPATWLNAGCWEDYPPETKEVPIIGFYASFTSPELAAWDAYGRAQRKSYPRDRRGGWTFPTQWPPGHETVSTHLSHSRPAGC